MRLKDREVTSPQAIDEIISSCKVLRLGLIDEEDIYIVPVCFGYINEAGHRSLFFHSAKEGRKVEILEKHPVIGFEMDTEFELHEADTACGHSAGYQSVIGKGVASRLESNEDKKKALELIMSSYTGKSNWQLDEKTLNTVFMFKIDVTEISCKENRRG